MNHFDRLPTFLRELIYRSGWTSFKGVQNKAFDILFGSDDHLLITAGTSSGKTEAALFPVITSLYERPVNGVGALYIGPTKALIDDQFSRISYILKNSRIKVTAWHGDVDQNRKKDLYRNAEGILQITPESLQGMITYHRNEVARIFSDLRYVIIDEVHAFMSSDRGSQILCQLASVSRIAGCNPIRIGLSATISDVESATEWLKADTDRNVSIAEDTGSSSFSIGIMYNHFLFMGHDIASQHIRKKSVLPYYLDLYKRTEGSECIVFVNSRTSAERTSKSLSSIADTVNNGRKIYVHHGSVSKEYRTQAEEAMKAGGNCTVVATNTLELGIDIGTLDKVVQVDAPYTCSNLVQRLGRTGRRGGERSMAIYCNDDDMQWRPGFPGISVNLIRAIALVELYKNDGWVEPSVSERLPFGLLYQQTMSYIYSEPKDVKFGDLVDDVLCQYPFSNIDREMYRSLIRHLIVVKQLRIMSDGTLLVDDAGFREVVSKGFGTVFTTKDSLEVCFNGKVIGTLQSIPEDCRIIRLAGKSWKIVSIEKRRIDVVESEEENVTDPIWRSMAPDIHTNVLRKMKDILESKEEYPYLDESAGYELMLSRSNYFINGMGKGIIPLENGYTIYPWLGSKQFDTFHRILTRIEDVTVVHVESPYWIVIQTPLTVDDLYSEIKWFIGTNSKESLIMKNDDLVTEKYDRYIPDDLLALSFATNRLDTSFLDDKEFGLFN